MEQEEKIENDIRSKTSENNAIKTIGKTKISKEERARLMEEKKLMKEVCLELTVLINVNIIE